MMQGRRGRHCRKEYQVRTSDHRPHEKMETIADRMDFEQACSLETVGGGLKRKSKLMMSVLYERSLHSLKDC